MLTRLQIANYKALEDLTLELTPIHAVIGPNDTGKSSILEAIFALSRSVDQALDAAFSGAWHGRQIVWKGKNELVTLIAAMQEDESLVEYGFRVQFAAESRNPLCRDEWLERGSARSDLTYYAGAFTGVRQLTAGAEQRAPNDAKAAHLVHELLSGAFLCRWNSKFLALPVAPDSKRRLQIDPSGFGLAQCLDDILGYDRKAFSELEERLCEYFPEILSVKLIAKPAYRMSSDKWEQAPIFANAEGKGIEFEFGRRRQLIPAAQVSDGVLLVLAYLTLLYLPEPPRFVLVEEPENGIHPQRLEQVISILRDMVAAPSRVQVVLTTHSPYVLDHFQPEEVTLCRKQENGSITLRRLSNSRAVREQLDVFTLGEIWTAEGDDVLSEPVTS